MQELCYTSIAQGLDRGKTGYTTAGRSDGMTRTVAEMAEKISGFNPLNPNNPLAYASEPVTFSHLVWQLSGRKIHIVSRKGACPPDYTGRSNFLAHHAMLTAEEAAACRGGPAALLGDDGFLMKAWQGPARLLPPRPVPALFDRERTTAALEAAGLEPGWGDALADRLRDPAVRQTWLIYSLEMDILGIVADVFSHLEPANRWATTFATHATRSFPGPGVECQLQCVVSGTDYAREVLTRQAGNVFDLTQRAAPPPRRLLASAVGPAGGTSMGSRGLAPATASSRARPQSTAATVAPVEVEDYSSILAQAQSIPAVPRRKTGFGSMWPWVAVSLAVSMTALSALFGYLWFDAKQTVTALKDQIRDLNDDHKKAVKDLNEAERRAQAAENKAQAAEQQASNDKNLIEDLKGQLAARNEKPASTPPAPAATKPANETPVSVAQPETPSQKTTTSTNVPASPTKEDGQKTSPPRAEAPAKTSDNSGKTASPRIHPGLIEDLAKVLKQNAKSNVVLLTELKDEPASHAIEVVENPSAQLLKGNCEKKGPDIVLQVLTKKVAEFVYDDNTQELKLEVDPKNPNGFLLKYLTLKVSPTGGSPISIPLGAPVNAKLAIHPASAGDLEVQEKEKDKPRYFRKEFTYRLFGNDPADKEAGEQLSLLLASKSLEEKKLVETFEFADSRVSTRVLGKDPPDEKTFVFYTTGTTGLVGVQLKRQYPEPGNPSQPATYKPHGVYVPLSSLPDDKWTRRPAFDLADQAEVENEAKKTLSTILTRLKQTDKQKDPKTYSDLESRQTTLQNKIGEDTARWKAAKEYPWQDLFNGIPFRLTLKPLDSRDEGDVGIVVVDSLGSGAPATAGRQGAVSP
jgi:hypothetical protein